MTRVHVNVKDDGTITSPIDAAIRAQHIIAPDIEGDYRSVVNRVTRNQKSWSVTLDVLTLPKSRRRAK